MVWEQDTSGASAIVTQNRTPVCLSVLGQLPARQEDFDCSSAIRSRNVFPGFTLLLTTLAASSAACVYVWGSPHQQAAPRHQQEVLRVSSFLTLCAQGVASGPTGRGLSHLCL